MMQEMPPEGMMPMGGMGGPFMMVGTILLWVLLIAAVVWLVVWLVRRSNRSDDTGERRDPSDRRNRPDG